MNGKSTAKKLPVRVEAMSRLVAYKPKSVVSREVIDKPTGSVTLFSFDRGEGLSEHTAPYDALAYVLDGAVRITIAGRPFILKKGEMIIMPGRKPHALAALKKFKMMLVMIRS
jgi:quercetin dioxygenase-like cupin family protein